MMEARKRSCPQCRSSPARRNQRLGRRLEWEGERRESHRAPPFPTPAPHTHTLWWPCLRPPCLEPTSWLSEAGGWGRKGEGEGE